jgi:hypothetical protein
MKTQKKPFYLMAWFYLNPKERLYLVLVILIALIGITARHLHLKSEKAVSYHPEGIEQSATGGYP